MKHSLWPELEHNAKSGKIFHPRATLPMIKKKKKKAIIKMMWRNKRCDFLVSLIEFSFSQLLSPSSLCGGRSFSLRCVTGWEKQEPTTPSSCQHSKVAHTHTHSRCKLLMSKHNRLNSSNSAALFFHRISACGGQRVEPARVPGVVAGWWNGTFFPATSAWMLPMKSYDIGIYFRQSVNQH